MTESSPHRDGITLRILGSFFLVLGLLVLAGIFWHPTDVRAVLVSAASGIVLGGIGGVMVFVGRKVDRTTAPESNGTTTDSAVTDS